MMGLMNINPFSDLCQFLRPCSPIVLHPKTYSYERHHFVIDRQCISGRTFPRRISVEREKRTVR